MKTLIQKQSNKRHVEKFSVFTEQNNQYRLTKVIITKITVISYYYCFVAIVPVFIWHDMGLPLFAASCSFLLLLLLSLRLIFPRRQNCFIVVLARYLLVVALTVILQSRRYRLPLGHVLLRIM